MSRTAPRILFISHDSSRTGAPIGLLAFMQWLRANVTCHIGTILRAPGPLEAAFRELGSTLTLGTSILSRSRIGRRVRSLLPQTIQLECGRVRRFFEQGNFDLIYSNTVTNGAIIECLAPSGVPVVTHVHELAYWIWRSGRENLERMLASTTSFVAASEAVRLNLIQNHGIPSSKIAVVYEHIRELPPIPTAADKESARAKLGLSKDALVVGGCGAEHWRKGRDLIPQLLVALRKLEPELNIHFVWIGRMGTREEEFTLRHDLELARVEADFHASGEVTDPFAMYAALDVFVLLSRDDPYPLACLEAAGTEKPVVCFERAGGMPEFVRDGCGIVVPYLDIEAMARGIITLVSQPDIAGAFGRRAREKVKRENTLATTGPHLLSIIEAARGATCGSAVYVEEQQVK